MRVPSAGDLELCVRQKSRWELAEHTLRIRRFPSGMAQSGQHDTLLPVVCQVDGLGDWMMLYPSPDPSSSTMYDPGFRPVQMAMPLERRSPSVQSRCRQAQVPSR